MKTFKQHTIGFGSVGRLRLATGLACAGMALISSAFGLITKDTYRAGDEQSNDKIGEIKDIFKNSAKK